MSLIRFYIVVLGLLYGNIAVSQQLKLGANPYILTKSAVLELSSDNQGLLLPRIADTSLINSMNPPDGMIIYFTPTTQFLLRANGYWNPLASTASLDSYWSTNGNNNSVVKRLGNIDNVDLPFVTNNVERMRILSGGNIGIGVSAPTATLHLRAGTTAAGSAPLKLTSGALMTTGEAGAVEFLTDKFYGTITSGNSRKEFTLNDAALTSGRLPFATTNGRLTNATNLYYSSNRFGVYQSSPTAFLHLGAGLTTASNAPLKFANGSLLTTPENGAMEYNGAHLYITIGTTRYQIDQQPGTTYTASNGISLSGTDFRNNLITGIAGGQTVVGGTDATNTLTLSSTLNAIKGKLLFGTSAYDEASNQLGVGNSSPTEALDVTGNVKFSGALMPNSSAGTSGFVLQSNGTGNAPSWLDINSSVSSAITANSWLQDGNSTSTLKNLGTVSNYALPFITNNIERMRLTTSGYLGIGTSAPSSLLHIAGTNPLTLTGVQNGNTTLSDSLLTINNGIVQKLPINTFATPSNSWSSRGNNGYNSAANFLGTTDNVSLRVRTNNIERLVIDSNGRVGVGNITPSERLDITGNLRISGAFMPNGSAGTMGHVLQSNGAGNAPSWVDGTTYINSNTWLQGGNSLSSQRNFGTANNYALPFITNNIERMRLTTGGFLGIGTSAPSTSLHVVGTNPLTLTGVQTAANTTSDSVLTITGGLVQKLPLSSFQSQINGTGYVKASGTTITYDNTTYTIANSSITGATKTKITFDSKGLVTAGEDATTSDIAEGSNLYYTDARVRNTPLTGLSTATATTVTATDNLLTGVGKLQGQINSINGAGYLTGNQTITLSGDVSGSGSTAITTSIGANRVTLGHMAQVATGSFLGRTTAGTGNVEALTTAQVRSMLSLSGTNSGDVTLAGQNYLTISGQTITANAVNLSGTHVTGTLAAARFGALTGDVTNTAGSYATTIANGAVTYTKMQNISASNRLLGRATTGAGSVEEITIGTGLTLTGTTLSASSTGQWSTTGNSGLSSFTNFLGTTDNVSLRFRTNNTERFIIDSIGRVGVGNTLPSERLDITGNLRLSGAFMPNGSAGTAGFVLQSNGAGVAPTWIDGTTYVTSNSWLQGGNNIAALRNFGTTSNFDLPFITNNTEAMRLTTTNRLGIGLTNPAERLEVNGNIRISGGNRRLVFATPVGDPDASIEHRTYGGTENNELLFYVGNDPNNGYGPDRIRMVAEEFRLQTFGTANGSLASAQSETGTFTRMLVTPEGNVGIGTTAPEDQLHVMSSTASGGTLVDVVTVETSNTTTTATSQPPNVSLVRQLPSFAAGTNYNGPALSFAYRTNGTVSNLAQILTISEPTSSKIAFYTRTGVTNSNPATGTLAENMYLLGTSLYVRNLTGGSTSLSVDANGFIIRTPSDARLKTNVSTITSPLEKIRKMRGVTYNWSDTTRFGNRKEMGFIAQELEQVVPEVVTEGGEYKSVNYQVLNALLTEAVKEQQKQIEDLKKDVQDLKSELLEIKKLILKEQKQTDKVAKEQP